MELAEEEVAEMFDLAAAVLRKLDCTDLEAVESLTTTCLGLVVPIALVFFSNVDCLTDVSEDCLLNGGRGGRAEVKFLS